MDIQLNIDKDAVEKKIVESVLNSSIGDAIEKAIKDALEKKGNYWDKKSIVENAVENVVAQKMRELVFEEVKKQEQVLRELVVERLTTEKLGEMLDGYLKADK